MIETINRWRHRKGFGVHSPLAFIIATEAIACPRHYRYYEEEMIEASNMDMRSRHHATRQCRLCHTLQRLNITDAEYIINPTSEQIYAAVERLRKEGGIIFEGVDYIVTIHRPQLAFYRYIV